MNHRCLSLRGSHRFVFPFRRRNERPNEGRYGHTETPQMWMAGISEMRMSEGIFSYLLLLAEISRAGGQPLSKLDIPQSSPRTCHTAREQRDIRGKAI
ncbi:hypothetical protein Mapa_009950 [Marchantia paleacea]|nr:hypothetical protein Mapa_009950 [Marchantia paleacea]